MNTKMTKDNISELEKEIEWDKLLIKTLDFSLRYVKWIEYISWKWKYPYRD